MSPLRWCLFANGFLKMHDPLPPHHRKSTICAPTVMALVVTTFGLHWLAWTIRPWLVVAIEKLRERRRGMAVKNKKNETLQVIVGSVARALVLPAVGAHGPKM
jgi:hypothetical protein